jgi:hypothetical protein
MKATQSQSRLMAPLQHQPGFPDDNALKPESLPLSRRSGKPILAWLNAHG